MEFIPLRFLDITLVQLLAVGPLICIISRRISPRLRPLMAVVCLGISVLAWSLSALWIDRFSGENLWPLILQQLLVLVPFVWGLSLFMQPLFPSKRRVEIEQSRENDHASSRLLWLSTLCLALFPAGVYRMSRVQAAQDQLHQFQSQMRIGEFVALSEDMLVIAPAVKYQERLLMRVVLDWEHQRRQLTDSFPQFPEAEQKARVLAMLGRRREALALLDLNSLGETRSVSRCLLAATIFEHEQDWTQSCFWYEQARTQLNESDRDSIPMLAAAYRGLGFCQRKQGEYRQAEAAYLSLLKLDPSAETHFLLAQFYQDTQVGEQAAYHLDQAVRLSEQQYAELATEMRARLQSHQFSCFQLWRSSNSGRVIRTP